MQDAIYKILDADQWQQAKTAGVFHGAEIDLKDGFIHFSTGQQLAETAEKHFAGQSNLIVLKIDAAKLGKQLKWEVSRGGQLFPHLYGDLSPDCVIEEQSFDSIS